MAVIVRVPTPLMKLTDNKSEVTAEGATINEILDNLEGQFAGIKERICDENGAPRRFINIYLNEEDIRFLQNLDTPLEDGTEVSILPAIAGGAAKKAPKKKREPKAVRRVYLTFVKGLVTKPIIYDLIKKFDVIPNIRGASVTDELGILSLEIQGSAEALEKAFKWLRKTGVKVDPIEMNVLEP